MPVVYVVQAVIDKNTMATRYIAMLYASSRQVIMRANVRTSSCKKSTNTQEKPTTAIICTAHYKIVTIFALLCGILTLARVNLRHTQPLLSGYTVSS